MTKNMIIIRETRPEDAKVLVEAEQAIAQTPGFLVSKPFELSIQKFQSKIEGLSNIPNGKYIVAEVDHQIVGHALLEPLHLSAIQHVVHLTIAVHEGSQEKGIGKAMLGYLIEWAKKTPSVEKIELHVRSENKRAISLYRKFGFQEEGRWKKRVKIEEGQYLDDILMGLWVGPN
jgi:putative acetyltransferase